MGNRPEQRGDPARDLLCFVTHGEELFRRCDRDLLQTILEVVTVTSSRPSTVSTGWL